MNAPIIEAEGLTKQFTRGKTTVDAVTNISFSVAAGSLVAFLGPNGAGKSTTLRMLTTLVPPTSGTARVVGHDIATAPHSVRASIGYVGQGTSGSFAQKVRDELHSQGTFYGVSKAQTRQRAEELIETLGLASFADRTVQQLSGGQKRRLDIAMGLMHAPPLLFLDEPSTGLDPHSRANLWEHILTLRAEHGTTVFFTTHYLDEADRFAERVMVMDRGEVIADDTAAALKATLAGDAITLGFASAEQADRAAPLVSALAGRDVVRADPTTLSANVDDGETLLPRVIRALDVDGLVVERATGVPPTLDDVFLALTGRTLREADAAHEPQLVEPAGETS
jgi:ABC-2 type transport system ATP-binding protein